jgi:hypothetical protein
MTKPIINQTVLAAAIILLPLSMLVFPATSQFPAGEDVKKEEVKDIQVPPPPFSEDIFPCSQCHGEMEPNPERRELDAHEDIVLKHDEKNRWCLDCHDEKNRDVLHLADGRPVDFKESYKLCGQCHGPKLRDWKNGVHGRRTGSWNGRKEYLLCAHCHNPHSPRFKPIKPEPAPVKPGDIK